MINLLFSYLKIIPDEFVGVSHDHVAFFKTFRGTTQVCARYTNNRAAFRIKQPKSLLRLRTAQYVIAREYTPLYGLIVRLKTIRIWYVTTLIKTEGTERRREERMTR